MERRYSEMKRFLSPLRGSWGKIFSPIAAALIALAALSFACSDSAPDASRFRVVGSVSNLSRGAG